MKKRLFYSQFICPFFSLSFVMKHTTYEYEFEYEYEYEYSELSFSFPNSKNIIETKVPYRKRHATYRC